MNHQWMDGWMDDDVRLSFKSCYLSGVHTTSILRQFNLHELKEMLFPSKIDRFYYGNRMLSKIDKIVATNGGKGWCKTRSI